MNMSNKKLNKISNGVRRLINGLRTIPAIPVLLILVIMFSNGCMTIGHLSNIHTTERKETKSLTPIGSPKYSPTGNYQFQPRIEIAAGNLFLDAKQEYSTLQKVRVVEETIRETDCYGSPDIDTQPILFFGAIIETIPIFPVLVDCGICSLLGHNAWSGGCHYGSCKVIDCKTIEKEEERSYQWLPLANEWFDLIISIKDDLTSYESSSCIQTDEKGKASVPLKIGVNGTKGNEIEVKTDVSYRSKTFSDTVSVKGNELLSLVALGTGSDWQSGKPTLPPYPIASANVSSAKAGEKATINIEVENKGKGSTYQLLARTKSKEPVFNGWWTTFGKIEPNKKSARTVLIPIPKELLSNRIPVTIRFEELNHFTPDPINLIVNIEGLPRPFLSYSYQIFDDGSGNSVGNGDGIFQKGEAVDILLGVKNTGEGMAKDVAVKIDLLSRTKDITVGKAKMTLGKMAPDESKTTHFTVIANKICALNTAKLGLKISETSFGIKTEETINLKLGEVTAAKIIVMSPTKVYVKAKEAVVYSGASADSVPTRFRVKKDSEITADGQLGDWYRVDLGENRVGWVHKADISLETPKDLPPVTTPQPGTVIIEVLKAPPLIVLAYPKRESFQTTSNSINLDGAVRDDRSVEKIDFVVRGKVIKTLTSRDIKVIPRKEIRPGVKTTTLNFDQTVSLEVGINEIKIIATDDEGLSSTKTITITWIKERGQIWAAVIGISDYKNDNIRDLKYCAKDAQEFREYLVDNLGIPTDHIFELLEEKASTNKIRSILGTRLKNKAGKNDTVIIFFAGHGATENDPANPDGDGLEKYLLPYDADLQDLYSTAIPMGEIRKIFQRIASERLVFIVDSCYSGALGGRTILASGTRANISDKFLNRISQGKGRVIITASNANEVAKEDEKLGHGVFTYYLLKGLRGTADTQPKDGMITVDEVYKYLCDNVPKATGQSQHPVKKGEVEGQIIIGRTK